ncbi:hypothetical protein LCGC14_2376820 [marine sediment metagenome]|uniref:Serine protease n=1 Tax=marine sediment metagenome TaxID=412755 RepID=A0A0F9C2A8_9ZZZZ
MNSLRGRVWLAIVVFFLMLLFLVRLSVADPTTAPLNNIVRIHIDSIKGSCGTGFIFEKGRILTAKHVIEKAKKQLIIRYSNGTIEKVKIKKCRVSKKYDLAEIPVKKDNLGVKLELSSIHYIGKKVYTSGYPDNWGILWVTTGIISSDVVSLPPPRLTKVFFSDIDVIAGNSGSPVFSYTDKLVGIVSSKYLCVTVVVSTEALKEFLDD